MESKPESDNNARPNDLEILVPGVEFVETEEIKWARSVVLESLGSGLAASNPELLREIWGEYSDACQREVDRQAPPGDPQTRIKLQTAAMVHRTLIFRDHGDIQRYAEELTEAGESARYAGLEEIAESIFREVDGLSL